MVPKKKRVDTDTLNADVLGVRSAAVYVCVKTKVNLPAHVTINGDDGKISHGFISF